MSTINFKVFETKPLKMLTTPYLGSTLLVGHSVQIPAQAEREGRQAADTLPGGIQLVGAPRWVPASG